MKFISYFLFGVIFFAQGNLSASAASLFGTGKITQQEIVDILNDSDLSDLEDDYRDSPKGQADKFLLDNNPEIVKAVIDVLRQKDDLGVFDDSGFPYKDKRDPNNVRDIRDPRDKMVKIFDDVNSIFGKSGYITADSYVDSAGIYKAFAEILLGADKFESTPLVYSDPKKEAGVINERLLNPLNKMLDRIKTMKAYLANLSVNKKNSYGEGVSLDDKGKAAKAKLDEASKLLDAAEALLKKAKFILELKFSVLSRAIASQAVTEGNRKTGSVKREKKYRVVINDKRNQGTQTASIRVYGDTSIVSGSGVRGYGYTDLFVSPGRNIFILSSSELVPRLLWTATLGGQSVSVNPVVKLAPPPLPKNDLGYTFPFTIGPRADDTPPIPPAPLVPSPNVETGDVRLEYKPLPSPWIF